MARLEIEPEEDERPQHSKGHKAPPPQRTRSIVFAILFLTFLGCAVLVVNKTEEEIGWEEEVEGETVRKIPKSLCPQFCKARSQQVKNHFGGDLQSNNDIVKIIDKARTKAMDNLKQKYGQYFDPLFMNGTDTIKPVFAASSSNSTIRFRRKLQKKILEVQVALRNDDQNVEGCICKSSRRRQLLTLPEIVPFHSSFIWSTGGHSASAGHGNFHNESYTAALEDISKPVFDALGIEFTGRGYAMGGMGSTPQLALCNEAVYGVDADVISWDFGMTDGTINVGPIQFYGNRIGAHRNRPAFFAIHIHAGERADQVLRKLDQAGMSIFSMKHGDFLKGAKEALPDTIGLTQEQIDAMPPYVKSFRCGVKIESGDLCDAEKYTPPCEKRGKKASWHPGWKEHALSGYSFGLYLIEELKQAAQELMDDTTYTDPAEKLQELMALEDEDARLFFASEVEPMEDKHKLPPVFLNTSLSPDDQSLLYRQPAICHNALLPAENRYLGYLQEIGDEFYKGTRKEDVDVAPSNGQFKLTYDSKAREDWCPIVTMIDYKDYFYASSQDDWTGVTLPNEMEAAAYGTLENPKGVIVLCFFKCDWGKCPKGDRHSQDLENGLLEMTVNGVAVSKFVPLDRVTCGLLMHESSIFFQPNKRNQFDFKVKVHKNITDETETLAYVRITGLIVL